MFFSFYSVEINQVKLKRPIDIRPPPFPAPENGYDYKVLRVLNDAWCDDYEAMPAYIKFQRSLIEAQRRQVWVESEAQTV